MVPGNYEKKRAFILIALLTALSVLSMLTAGCSTADKRGVGEERDREVKIDEPVDIQDGDEIEKMRLLQEYERALRLFEAGEIRAAKVTMVSVRAQAKEKSIELPEEFEEDFRDMMETYSEMHDEDKSATEEQIPQGSQEEFRKAAEDVDIQDMPEAQELISLLKEGKDIDEEYIEGEYSEHYEELGDLGEDIEYEAPEFKLPGLLDPEMADEKIILDFNEVDIRIVLETISDITGANFLVDGGVSGTITLISSSEVRLDDVFRILESILEVNGWVAVPSEDVIKVLPREKGARRHIPTRIGMDPKEIPRDDGFSTQVMSLEHLDIKEAIPLIEPRMSPEGNLSAHEPTNTLFITDISSNIYQIALMVTQIDLPRKEEQIVVLPLKYASARALADTINSLIESSETESPRWQTELQILPDSRTNSLIVFAEQVIISNVQNLLEKLDVPRPDESVNVHVIKLNNADAEEMVNSLTPTIDALTDYEDAEPIHITSDNQTNSLIIASSPQDIEVLNAVINDLDIVREQVLVELRIMEATQRALKEVGFDWSTMDEPSPDSLRGLSSTFLGPRSGIGMDDGALIGREGIIAALVKGDKIGAVMKALQTNRYVDVLSTPHLLTSNHQEATISVVENVPYVRESRINTDDDRDDLIETYDYRNVGLHLKITPHIGAGGMVRMAIESEFSKIVEEGNGRIRTSERSANTTVGVESGETVVIGGLMQDDKVSVTNKVPLLGSIPLIGHLFQFESDDIEKTNLLLFITPHVLVDSSDLAAISERKKEETEKKKHKLKVN